MGRFFLLLSMALSAAGILATVPPGQSLAAQTKDGPKQPGDEPVVPEKLGKLTLTLDPGWHTRPVRKVFFTPDGKQVITISSDQSIRIWDPLTGETQQVLYPPGAAGLGAAALSSDGKRLAVASRYPGAGPAIYVLTLPEGQVERVLRGHKGSIGVLAFSPDGKRLASGSSTSFLKQDGDNTIRIWRLDKEEAGQMPHTFGNFGPTGLCFSPDSRRLVAVGRLQGQIFDLGGGKKGDPLKFAAALKGYDKIITQVNEVDWSADGKTLATISSKGVNLWDADGKPRMLFPTRGIPSSVVFSPDSRTCLVTWNAEPKEFNKATLFEVLTGKPLFEFPSDKVARKPAGMRPLSGAVSPDGQLAVTAGGSTCVWNTQDGAIHKEWVVKNWLPTLSHETPRAAWSADGKAVAWKVIASSAKTPAFHLGDLQFGPPLGKKDAHGPVLKQGAWSLEKLMGNKVRVLKDGKRTALLEFKGAVLGATLLSKDRVAIAVENSPLGLYDTNTGNLIRNFKGQPSIYTDGIAASPDGRFLLTISWDQKLRIWNQEQDKLLLTLFMSGKDWVVWAPEGYYAASPGGEKFIGWKMDNGIDKMPTYYPAERFRKQLYRPDVIQRLLEFGSVEKALEAADKERGIKSTRVPLEDALPPHVLVIAPAAGTVLKDAKVEIRAKTVSQGKFPITELQLLLGGRPIQGGLFKVDAPKLGAVESSWTIELPPGHHQLSVVARTAVSSGLSSEVEVTYEVPKVIDTRPTLYVLSIGINTYPGDWKLNCAAKDAVGIENVFRTKTKDIYQNVKTKLLTDNAATKKEILDGLGWLRQNMKARDVAVIFYAGHGINDKQGKFYLLPVDTDFNAIERSAVSDDEIKKRLAEMPGRILLMLDACHSGATRARVDRLARDLSDDDCGVVVMCAAAPREEAGEDRKIGHGYFAHAVIQGLSGKADTSRKSGRVYLHHLDAYVYETVVELSNDEQHPMIGRPTSVRTFALAKP